MPLKMSKELNDTFKTCTTATLSPQVTHLVTLAAQLAGNQHAAAQSSLQLGQAAGVTLEQLNRCACMAACAAGPQVQAVYVTALQPTAGTAAGQGPAGTPPSGFAQPLAPTAVAPTTLAPTAIGHVALAAPTLDLSVFNAFRMCSAESLDKKTNHLVGLAACLAARCACAAGHMVEARNAGATDVELARCACLAACASGMQAKYQYLEHLQNLTASKCKACVCEN